MSHDVSKNNFDLIRLLAAAQVAVLHVLYYLSSPWRTAPLIQLLELFPGVPVFFFISGFLISRSYEKTGSLADYWRNRALRIFPALHVCVLLNLLLVLGTGYFALVGAHFWQIAVLYLAKTTIFQFYNPDFMRGFGDGVLNGSLWTICVELQFYFLTPILYAMWVSDRKQRTNLVLVGLIIASLVCNRLLYSTQPEFAASVYWKLARVSFLPWIYMFLVGVLTQRNFARLAQLQRNWLLPILLPTYLGYALLLHRHGFGMDNSVSPLVFFPLAAVVFVGAFSAPALARKLLRGQDISYGIYIYHVVVMNTFLFYHRQGRLMYTVLVLAITAAVALASWFLVERPCLRKKHRATHPVISASSLPVVPQPLYKGASQQGSQ